jgi:hypothetical protein
VRALYLFLICCLLSANQIRADIVSPTRLEIKEVEPGIFEVFFVQPVIQGKVLKAQPVLPSICVRLTDPQISGDYNMKISQWRISCAADSLYGKRFGIEGLLGTQVDILFSLELLNGRSYQKMLSPINAFFVVPNPPGILQLSGSALLSGLKGALAHLPLYLLIMVVVLGVTYQSTPTWGMLILATAGYAGGQMLASMELLLLPENIPALATLLATLLLSLQLLYKSFSKNVLYWWLPTLLGMAFGGVGYLPDALAGFDQGERITSSVISYIGFGIGLVLIYGLCLHLVYTVQYLSKNRQEIILGYLCGIVSFALLVYQFTPYLFTSGPAWTVPFLSVFFVLALSIWVSYTRLDQGLSWHAYTAFLIAILIAGVLTAASGIQIGWATAVILMVIFSMSIYMWFKVIPARWFNMLMMGLGAVMCGYDMSQLAHENLSYASAQVSGFVLILGLVWVLSQQITPRLAVAVEKVPGPGKAISILMVILVGMLWYREFSQIHWTNYLAEYAIGILLVPLVSLLLIALAWWFWPRYKSIHQSMGLSRRVPVTSILLLGGSLFLLPWFTLKANNPFQSSQQPDLQQVEGITQQVLSNTYQAFNLEDEDRLFEQLALSVDQDLIEDIYLDSRRKLRSGVRQGAEVTVREVELLEISDWNNTDGANTLSLDSKWVVTARVKHLQHIHHRRNQYTGTIVLKTEDSRWKISNIVLTSEDREVVPTTSG